LDEGVLGRCRNHEADDAVVVDGDEEGEVGGVEVGESGGCDDEGWGLAELVGGGGEWVGF
jgi:hypothetical protein